MSSTTTINALRYAVQSDTANAQTGFQQLAEDLDTRLVPRFSSAATRDTAISSPTNGQACYITGSATGGRTLQVYNGTSWINYFRGPVFAYKTAQESVTSSTTVQADNDLVVALEANTTYTYTMALIVTGVDAGDLKHNFTYPTGCSVSEIAFAYSTASTGAAPVLGAFGYAQDATSPTPDYTSGTITSTPVSLIAHGVIVVGSTAGSLTLMWAQNTSNGTATNLEPGSHIVLTRVA